MGPEALNAVRAALIRNRRLVFPVVIIASVLMIVQQILPVTAINVASQRAVYVVYLGIHASRSTRQLLRVETNCRTAYLIRRAGLLISSLRCDMR